MAPKTKTQVAGVCLFISLVLYLLWKFYHVQQKLRKNQLEEDSYLSSLINKFWKSEEMKSTEFSSVTSEFWNSILTDYEIVKVWTIDFICLFIPRGITSIIARTIQVICAALLIFIIVTRYCGYVFWRMGKQKESKPRNKRKKNSISSFFDHLTLRSVLGFLTILTLLISIPFEYMRLYQEQVAKKVAVMKVGAPRECVPQEMNFLESLKYWINWELSWVHDPCEKYHKAMLVDPLWEISPLLVLWSALVRGILHPIELFFSSIGKSFKLFFSEIPAQWQPFMFILIVFVFVVVMVMSCSYRISLPFILKIEPKTPVTQKTTSRVQLCAKKQENALCSEKEKTLTCKPVKDCNLDN
ncbi:chloride channel CLIC-like protein 1 [Saccostrea cucullata]|uniref:chloride channel CLIC-like protein 1 n=1 Tax=Saccostrea cuccullata TaxID=36930 RepID=UPI002ED0175D